MDTPTDVTALDAERGQGRRPLLALLFTAAAVVGLGNGVFDSLLFRSFSGPALALALGLGFIAYMVVAMAICLAAGWVAGRGGEDGEA